ncbi:MAG: thiamine phosphate synthase [Campylobacterales bacterium]|nr:thiamine phosphate synthase [Campylobacterales bacterium]
MKSYLITDPKYYTNNPIKFKEILENILIKHKPDMVCFRDKQSSNFEQLAKIFVDICKSNNIEKILINERYELAQSLGFDGVHLTSKQFDKIPMLKELGLFTIVSCHNDDELNLAKKYNANMLTYSPIFDTPNKGKAKGIEELMKVSQDYKLAIIALGGILHKSQIEQLSTTKVIGWASIRYFIN